MASETVDPMYHLRKLYCGGMYRPVVWTKRRGRFMMLFVPIGSVPLDYLRSLWLRSWRATVWAWVRG